MRPSEIRLAFRTFRRSKGAIMRRVRSVCIAASLALAMVVAPSANAGQPVKVVATRAHEFGQSAVNGAFAWAVDRRTDEFTYDVKARLGTAAAFRVNPAKTTATMGGLDLGNPLADVLLTYARSRAIRDKQWDIRLYDVEARAELAVPAGINTRSKREAGPTISGDLLLFELSLIHI